MMLKSTAASDKNIHKKYGLGVACSKARMNFLFINELKKKIIRDRNIDIKGNFSGSIVAPVARLLPWGPKLAPLVRELHQRPCERFKIHNLSPMLKSKP